jgi:hypothetical protein
MKSMAERLRDNGYVGRGLVIGRSADGRRAVLAYFIMGRSQNSQNRVFEEQGDDLIIRPFDASLVRDPSLIIYSPVRKLGNRIIVTNGNQTDTIYEYLREGRSFEEALDTREFEPDAPNFTPRISGLLCFTEKTFTYKMNILKSADASGSACTRQTFSYPALAGLGHFLHTYVCDGDPLPSFRGEPERVCIPNDIGAITSEIWAGLDKQTRVSLYVRTIDLKDGHVEKRLINKNVQEAER